MRRVIYGPHNIPSPSAYHNKGTTNLYKYTNTTKRYSGVKEIQNSNGKKQRELKAVSPFGTQIEQNKSHKTLDSSGNRNCSRSASRSFHIPSTVDKAKAIGSEMKFSKDIYSPKKQFQSFRRDSNVQAVNNDQPEASHINLSVSPSKKYPHIETYQAQELKSIMKTRDSSNTPTKPKLVDNIYLSRRVKFSPSVEKKKHETSQILKTKNVSDSFQSKRNKIRNDSIDSKEYTEEDLSERRKSISRIVQGSINFNRGPRRKRSSSRRPNSREWSQGNRNFKIPFSKVEVKGGPNHSIYTGRGVMKNANCGVSGNSTPKKIQQSSSQSKQVYVKESSTSYGMKLTSAHKKFHQKKQISFDAKRDTSYTKTLKVESQTEDKQITSYQKTNSKPGTNIKITSNAYFNQKLKKSTSKTSTELQAHQESDSFKPQSNFSEELNNCKEEIKNLKSLLQTTKECYQRKIELLSNQVTLSNSKSGEINQTQMHENRVNVLKKAHASALEIWKTKYQSERMHCEVLEAQKKEVSRENMKLMVQLKTKHWENQSKSTDCYDRLMRKMGDVEQITNSIDKFHTVYDAQMTQKVQKLSKIQQFLTILTRKITTQKWAKSKIVSESEEKLSQIIGENHNFREQVERLKAQKLSYQRNLEVLKSQVESLQGKNSFQIANN